MTTEEFTKPDPLIVSVKSAPPENTTDGEMLEIDGTGLLAAVTWSVSVVLCCKLPDVPVTVHVNVPAAADDEAVSVRVEDALLPEGGVTLTGENVAVTPPGKVLETLRPVTALKPFRLMMVTVEVALLPLPPAVTDTEFGATPMLKSTGGLVETVSERPAV